MPALVTPFNSVGKTINEKSLREIIDFQLGQGADGFYVLGSIGEGLLMAEEDRMKVCEIAVE